VPAPSRWPRSVPTRPTSRSTRSSKPRQPLSFADQGTTLENFSFTLFRTEVTRSSDTVEALLSRLGISDPAATAFVRGNADAPATRSSAAPAAPSPPKPRRKTSSRS
jgi:hypothetical protein